MFPRITQVRHVKGLRTGTRVFPMARLPNLDFRGRIVGPAAASFCRWKTWTFFSQVGRGFRGWHGGMA